MNELISQIERAGAVVYGRPVRIYHDSPAITGNGYACCVVPQGDSAVPAVTGQGPSPSTAAAQALQQLVQHRRTVFDQKASGVQQELARMEEEHAQRTAVLRQQLEQDRAPLEVWSTVAAAALEGRKSNGEPL